MLIDKRLARYSSDFVVCRELIQNADDAQATTFCFEMFCEEEHFTIVLLPKFVPLIMEISLRRSIGNEWLLLPKCNTNIDSVGQFGVEFFSVFSFSEEPIIISGQQYLTFTWRNDDSLATFRCALPNGQESNLTSIILKVRNKYILNTETTLTEQENEVSSHATDVPKCHCK
jgi:HSP90 family molecular chaperone